MKFKTKFFQFSTFFVIVFSIDAWKNIPAIPSNRRSQFYLRHDDGAYNYGYDSGDGSAAQQKSTDENQVEGFYSFLNEAGEIVKVKYTAGVQGFVPEIIGQSQAQSTSNSWQSQHAQNVKLAQQQHQNQVLKAQSAAEDSNVNADASYQISYNTGEHAREEKSDSSGNVHGRYSYVDEAGSHDLTYIAGPKTGFVVTGGSLSKHNGLSGSSVNHTPDYKLNSNAGSEISKPPNPDNRSYNFFYKTDDHARSETSDAAGNVQGGYSYTDEAGTHDLTYTAGADTGFVVTGGSLSKPNGLVSKQAATRSKKVWSTPVPKEKAFEFAPKPGFWANSEVKAAVASNSNINRDTINSNGSAYGFFYNADSHARQEESDADGNVRGSYAIRTGTGYEELEYEAGKDGFVVVGGSLAPKPPSWEDSTDPPSPSFNLQQQFGEQPEGFVEEDPFPDRGFFADGRPRPLQIPNDHRPYSQEKSVQPTFTIVAPSVQKSFEYGPKNAIILGFLPPKHDKNHGYIYDTES